MTRMLVCGDRNWLDRRHSDGSIDQHMVIYVTDRSQKVLTAFASINAADVLMEGCARGGDHLAELWAAENEDAQRMIKEHIHFPAQWDKYGRSAGPLRNIQMLMDGRPDFVVALHDDIENSKGTRHMAEIARSKNVPVHVITTEDLSAYG